MRGFNTHLTTCCPRGAVELTRYSFDPGHERGFNTHAMDVFFLDFRQKRPLTTRNANAQGCYFSKWRTSQRGKEKNQSGLATNNLRTLYGKKNSKLCDIEVMEVDEANKRLKIHYIGRFYTRRRIIRLDELGQTFVVGRI